MEIERGHNCHAGWSGKLKSRLYLWKNAAGEYKIGIWLKIHRVLELCYYVCEDGYISKFIR